MRPLAFARHGPTIRHLSSAETPPQLRLVPGGGAEASGPRSHPGNGHVIGHIPEPSGGAVFAGPGLLSRAVSPDARALALVVAHCDIAERLPLVPPSSCVRGIYFKSIEKQVAALGVLERYREYFPADRFGSLSFYPVSAYMVRLACAGALVASPERLHEGMLTIAKGNAKAFIESVLGRLLLRVLSGDPIRLVEQAIAGHRQSTNYGHWEVVRLSDRAVEVVYRQEYVWIESAIAGAGLGTFEACGLAVKMENRLVDRFNGSSFYTW